MGVFKFFSKRKEVKPLAPPQERTAIKIAEKILAVQRSTAEKLNAWGHKMGEVKTRIILGALLLAFAAYLVHIIINALF